MEFKYSIEKTKFGSNVLLIPRKSPLVSFQIWVRAGSKYERPGITGISHMLEHMMFKGSKNYGPQEHAKRVQELGGEFNAFTSHDKTVYFENISPTYLEEVIKMEADRFLYPAFDPEEFQREKKVVMEERKLRTDNSPYGRAEEELFSLAFQAHPYHWPIIGWASDIENFSRQILISYFRERYTPENSFFVLCGNVPENSMELIDKYFKNWQGGKPQDIPLPKEEVQRVSRRAELIMDVQVPFVFMGFVAPGYCNPDFPYLSVIDRVLTEGESSKLWQDLVHDRGIAIKAGGGVYPLGDYSLFFFYAISSGKGSVESLQEALAEKVLSVDLKDKELEKAKVQVLAETISSLEKSYYTGLSAGEGYIDCGDPERFIHHLNIIRKAERKTVLNVWERILRKDRMNTVIIKGEK